MSVLPVDVHIVNTLDQRHARRLHKSTNSMTSQHEENDRMQNEEYHNV